MKTALLFLSVVAGVAGVGAVVKVSRDGGERVAALRSEVAGFQQQLREMKEWQDVAIHRIADNSAAVEDLDEWRDGERDRAVGECHSQIVALVMETGGTAREEDGKKLARVWADKLEKLGRMERASAEAEVDYWFSVGARR